MSISDKISETTLRYIQKFRYVIFNNKEAFRFLVIFLSLSFLFFIIYYLLQESLEFILYGTAAVAGFISNLIGLSVTVDGVLILTESMNFEIIHECTGIFAIMIISASIFAYPTEWKKKILGLVFVIPLILVLNIVRLLVLIYIGKFHTDLFEYVHSYLWQGTFIIFIILAWFLWIELVVHR